MRGTKRLSSLLLLAMLSLAAGAEVAPTEVLNATGSSGATVSTVRPFSAALELRPSWGMEKQEAHSENELALRYSVAPGFSLAYVQEFHTNLSNPAVNGLDFRLADGYLRGDIDEIWSDRRRGLTLSYQARLYVPTARDARAPGFIGELRNGFRLGWKLGSAVELALKEIPIVPAFSRAASVVDGELTANAWFENRMELELNVAITSKLSFKLPLILQSLRNRAEDGAKFSDSWRHLLWVYPELVYSLGERTGLGLGYYSANLLEDVGRGFRNGVPQLILQQSI